MSTPDEFVGPDRGGIGAPDRGGAEPGLSDPAGTVHAMTNTITPETTQTWREFADQLPAHAIGRFERHELLTELHGPLAFPEEDPAEVIRRDQRMMYEEARDQVPFAHVALPESAIGADLWTSDDDGNWYRVVDGGTRSTGRLGVSLSGIQTADGAVVWTVSADTKDDAVSPAQLREYATLLTAAADELDRLARG